MNPYHALFDNPVRLNADEHTEECAQGGGIPWGSANPHDNWRAPETCSTVRERCARLLAELNGDAA